MASPWPLPGATSCGSFIPRHWAATMNSVIRLGPPSTQAKPSAVQLDRPQHLASFRHVYAPLVGYVGVPDGVARVRADPVGGAFPSSAQIRRPDRPPSAS